MHLISRKLALIAGVIAMSCAFVPVGAQTFPTRSMRMIVPFAPGGGIDIVGRIVAQRLSDALGQPVVVDNRSAAGGTFGTNLTAKAAPDGHTLLTNSISMAVNATLYAKLPYDTLKDLAPVGSIGRQPSIVVVHPALAAKSIGELLALARAKPGQLNYGSGGMGSVTFLSTELLKLMTQVDIKHVPYKGLGPALIDLMGGQTQVIVSTMATALPALKSGRIRALAVTTAKRSTFFPDLPTLDEAGVPGYEFSTWYALLATGGTPKSVIARLSREMAGILNSDALKEQFSAQGIETAYSSPDAFAAYLKSEVAKWGKVVKATGATPE